MMNTHIYDKKTSELVGIKYNPYNKTVKYMLDFWIPGIYRKKVRGKNIYYK